TLARIKVSDSELDALAGELGSILAWIEQLNEVDVSGVAPMTSVAHMKLPMRDDKITEGGGVSELTRLTLSDARDGLRAGEFSARELTEAHLDAMAASRSLNAFVTETPERALAMAAASDARLAQGQAGLLEGLPVAVKDLFCTKDILTTACSRILDGFKPPYESTVTQKLWDSGAVMLGKTSLDEFAMGSSNSTSCHGPVENPWRRRGDNRPLVPGGSSGGSAAAVAARLALGATGTDTGGSIRQPASFCGVVGMKPTY